MIVILKMFKFALKIISGYIQIISYEIKMEKTRVIVGFIVYRNR